MTEFNIWIKISVGCICRERTNTNARSRTETFFKRGSGPSRARSQPQKGPLMTKPFLFAAVLALALFQAVIVYFFMQEMLAGVAHEII